MARLRRQKVEDEPDNHERWLVSYADFITLLFAFFVVMYSISSVNEGKYRVLSDSLDDAFTKSLTVLTPIQIGETKRYSQPIENLISGHPESQQLPHQLDKLMALEADQSQISRISNQIEEVLSPYIDQELIDIRQHDLWLEVEMKSSLLFASGSAKLSRSAYPLLSKISQLLRHLPNSIQVEGYTDDIPIDTVQFPSNWELSAGRAARVVSQLTKQGVSPLRMAAIGYGQYHSVADNRTETGRYQNRRVVLVLLAQSASRHKILSNERSRLLKSATPKPQTIEPAAPKNSLQQL